MTTIKIDLNKASKWWMSLTVGEKRAYAGEFVSDEYFSWDSDPSQSPKAIEMIYDRVKRGGISTDGIYQADTVITAEDSTGVRVWIAQSGSFMEQDFGSGFWIAKEGSNMVFYCEYSHLDILNHAGCTFGGLDVSEAFTYADPITSRSTFIDALNSY